MFFIYSLFNHLITVGCSLVSILSTITAIIILGGITVVHILITVGYRDNDTLFNFFLNLSILFGFICIVLLGMHFNGELVICKMHK